MTDLWPSMEGDTPLDPSDADGLIPTWVTFRSELNAVEQENIVEAVLWASGKTWDRAAFDREWPKELHRRMFNKVWRWAGRYRRTDTNIGLPWHQIEMAVEDLILNLGAQLAHPEALPWSPQELAVRFHYQMVTIHPFPNGNGRHARLAADIVLSALGHDPLPWGDTSRLTEKGPLRAEYIAALRNVDEIGDFSRLLSFATGEASSAEAQQ